MNELVKERPESPYAFLVKKKPYLCFIDFDSIGNAFKIFQARRFNVIQLEMETKGESNNYAKPSSKNLQSTKTDKAEENISNIKLNSATTATEDEELRADMRAVNVQPRY